MPTEKKYAAVASFLFLLSCVLFVCKERQRVEKEKAEEEEKQARMVSLSVQYSLCASSSVIPHCF